MTSQQTINAVAALSDEDAARGIMAMIGLLGMLGQQPEKVIEAVAKMVGDLRAAERLRIERASVGAKVAAECLKGET